MNSEYAVTIFFCVLTFAAGRSPSGIWSGWCSSVRVPNRVMYVTVNSVMNYRVVAMSMLSLLWRNYVEELECKKSIDNVVRILGQVK